MKPLCLNGFGPVTALLRLTFSTACYLRTLIKQDVAVNVLRFYAT